MIKINTERDTPACCNSKVWEGLWFLAQIIVIVLYCTCCTFEAGVTSNATNETEFGLENAAVSAYLANFYPMWMDIHVMIFIGFGWLMAFLKTHSWSSIGINFICAAWALQLCTLFTGFWRRALLPHHFSWNEKINITMLEICEGEFCAAAFLISMGALLGKASLPQLFFLATMESIVFALNAVVLFEKIYVVDIGGAMTIHMFGAYFGLAATYFFMPKKALADESGRAGESYNSALVSLVGTVFLWMYWPSFNGVLGAGMAQHRAVVNTVLSISGSCISAIAVSRLLVGRLNFEVLANATLAGGVMMGAACHMITNPGYAMLAGAIAGAVSSLGYHKINAMLQSKLYLHDTCGVHFLHGIPGFLGSIVSVITVAVAKENFENDFAITDMVSQYPKRTLEMQACIQLAGIAITWAISIPSGLLFGFLASRLPMPAVNFNDTETFDHVTYAEDMKTFDETTSEKHKLNQNEELEMTAKHMNSA